MSPPLLILDVHGDNCLPRPALFALAQIDAQKGMEVDEHMSPHPYILVILVLLRH